MRTKTKKYLIISIDTEGDNLWSVSDIKQKITTYNSKFLIRFQELCEKYGFKPTYLTNYEMAIDETMIKFGREGLKKGTLEIGAHEHAWNQPPLYKIMKRPGKRGKPYLSEYPKAVIGQKLEYLTKTLEDSFQCSITSHRGGRWCLNATIVDELSRLGYLVDCTCTPGVNWKANRGWSPFSSGTDWSTKQNEPYYLNLDGNPVLEVPVSIYDQRGSGKQSWLRPGLYNQNEMISLLQFIYDSDKEFAQFMLHSSELMPGGNAIFTNAGKIDYLYKTLNELFSFAKELGFEASGITDYAKIYADAH